MLILKHGIASDFKQLNITVDLMVAVALASASAGLNRVLLKWRDGCNLPQDR
jgi:hypothetical protein